MNPYRLKSVLVSSLWCVSFCFFSSVVQSEIVCKGLVTDHDGNTYETAQIGEQIWMLENLRSSRRDDGTEIEGFVYDDDPTNVVSFGLLYRFEEAIDGQPIGTSDRIRGISPEGWHIPSIAEWRELISFLGGESVAGGIMKRKESDQWKAPNTGAMSDSLFNAMPTGWYDFTGSFKGKGETCFFRTATLSARGASSIEISHKSESIRWVNLHPDDAIPIRCIKDQQP